MEYISIEEYKSLDLSNRIIYIRLLDKLEQQSISFNLVNPHTFLRKKESEKVLTKSEIALSDYLISEKWVKKWPGTKSGQKVYMRTFATNKLCIDYFRKISSFFCLDDQIDISFFNNNNKLLWFSFFCSNKSTRRNTTVKRFRKCQWTR